MNRRTFIVVVAAFAITPAQAQDRIKVIRALAWAAHDVDGIRIGLLFEDQSSLITTIPTQWLFDHPIETLMLAEGTPDAAKLDWVSLCAEVVEMYVNGK